MSSNQKSIVLLILVIFCNLYRSQEDDFKSCIKYTSFGYGYRDFFEFRRGNINSSYIFNFSFYVKTVSDAHILLKSEMTVNDSIEIVIGGGSNTFSQIRLLGNEEKKTVLTQKTEHILSELNYKKFQISIDKNGIIFVKMDDDIFLNWRFDHFFSIRYFAFGSWTNTKADWRFGCSEHKDIVKDQSNVTPLQRLKNDLFTYYDPNAVPNESTLAIDVKFKIHNVHLNEKRGELTIYGTGVLKWKDKKMIWKPEDYNGIDHMLVPPFQIWTPYLRVLNVLGVDINPLFDLTASGVLVLSDGSIFWRPPFKSVSSCVVNLGSWPYDSHNCSVLIGFWMEPPNLVLTVTDEYEMMQNFKGGSEWNIIGAISFNGRDDDDNNNYAVLYVELQRNQEGLAMLLRILGMASDILSLSSFWVSLEDTNKFYLSCGSVIMFLVTLLLAGQTIPTMIMEIPRIIVIYSWSVVIACFPVLVFVFLNNISKNYNTSESINRILNHDVLDRIFCLPDLPSNTMMYGHLSEQTYKMNSDHITTTRLVLVIERIFFVLYLIILMLRYYLL